MNVERPGILHESALKVNSFDNIDHRNENVKCFNCGGFGHISKACPSESRGM